MTESDGEKLNRLIRAVADGFADCLDGVYSLAGGKMYAVALSIVGKDYAEDVLHDSFIKVARFARRFNRGDNAYGWLMKIVRNTALDLLKSRNLRGKVSTEEFYSLTSLDYSPEKRESAIMLEQALAKLEPDDRAVIYRIYFLDMTVREIASESGLSKSAVQRAKDRAEKQLKALLGGTNDGE